MLKKTGKYKIRQVKSQPNDTTIRIDEVIHAVHFFFFFLNTNEKSDDHFLLTLLETKCSTMKI